MEFEFWWLLAIPLFFGLGWAAARIDARHLIRASSRLPDAYFKGLNFLLNEQPDKAIDAFVDVVKLDPETIELHFALGNLFRRRGETERAIRVHQNLVARSDLLPGQREHALFELGQDFLKAGLLDRAEDAFNRLEGSSYAAAALHHRLEIAQMVRDWPLAIDLAERLQRGGSDQRHLIAHFHCELAQQALARGVVAAPVRETVRESVHGSDQRPAGSTTAAGADAEVRERLERARREIDAALAARADHPRPWLMRGEMRFAEGEFAAALDDWRRAANLGPAHLALIGDRWMQAHERVGRLDEGITTLERVHREHPSIDALRAIARGRAQRDGRDAAIAWLQAELARAPSLLGLQQLLELRGLAGRSTPTAGAAVTPAAASGVAEAGAATSAEPLPESALTATLVQRHAVRLSRFVCSHCGFKARQFYWQCPGCNRWDSYPPKRTEELEGP